MKHQILNTLAAGVVLLAVQPSQSAQVPNLVSHQGRVAVNGVNFDGNGQFKFALVNADGSVSYWSNDQTSTGGSEPTDVVSLPVTKGLYSVLLGDNSMSELPVAVFSNADVRLRVWFNDGIFGFQQLTPDQRLATNGYLPDGAVWRLDAPDGSPTGAVQVDAAGLVGISAALAVNGSITSTGTISGNGSGLTGINAANLTGSVPGTSLTSVPATSLTGTIAEARLPGSVALRNASNTFTATQFVNGDLHVLGWTGFGTYSPAQPLQIGDPSIDNSRGMMRFASHGSGNTAAWSSIWDVGAPVSSTEITGRYLSFVVDNPLFGTEPELMVRWDNGFVGIGGVPYPATSLHLYSQENPTIFRIQSTGTPGFGRIEFMSNPQGDPNEWRPGYIQSGDSGNFTGSLRFVVNGTGVTNRNNSIETMRIVDGRVGIRTATPSPQYVLDVNGNAHVSGQLISDTAMFAPAFNISSDRDVKENFEPIDPREMLDKVVELPLSRWNFKNDPDVEHIGPMAQDFRAAFATGIDDKHIATVDADGVALAAIQGLNHKLASELERKAAELAELRQAVQAESSALKAENAAMEQRLATLEAMMRELQPTGIDTGGIR